MAAGCRQEAYGDEAPTQPSLEEIWEVVTSVRIGYMLYIPCAELEQCRSQLLLVPQPGSALCSWLWVGLSEGIHVACHLWEKGLRAVLRFWQPGKYLTCSLPAHTPYPTVSLLIPGPSTPRKCRVQSLCRPDQLGTQRTEPHHICYSGPVSSGVAITVLLLCSLTVDIVQRGAVPPEQSADEA